MRFFVTIVVLLAAIPQAASGQFTTPATTQFSTVLGSNFYVAGGPGGAGLAPGFMTGINEVNGRTTVDLNGNGYPDVVFSDFSGIGVLLDPGLGNISNATYYGPPATNTTFLGYGGPPIVGNFNGDAFPDLLLATNYWPGASGPPSVIPFFNDTTGHFFPSSPIPNPYGIPPSGLVLAYRAYGRFADAIDVNLDGLDDIIIPEWGAPSGNGLRIYLATGTVAFNYAYTLPGIGENILMGHGDFDANGRKDILTTTRSVGIPQLPAGYVPPYCTIRYGNVSGGFGAPTNFPAYVGDTLPECIIQDVDLDGADDLRYGASTNGGFLYSMYVVWGTPAQHQFTTTQIGSWVCDPGIPIAADLDSDGVNDLIYLAGDFQTNGPSGLTPCWFSQFSAGTIVRVIHGIGGKQFRNSEVTVAYSPLGFSNWVAPADYDLDGDIDLLGLPIPKVYTTGTYSNLNCLFINNRFYGTGCNGTNGAVGLTFPLAYQGNSAFSITLTGGRPNSPAALLLGLGRTSLPSCGIAVDLSPNFLILPYGNIGIGATNALGQFTVPIPIPLWWPDAGTAFFIQGGIVDPFGALNVGGGINVALTRGQTVVVTY